MMHQEDGPLALKLPHRSLWQAAADNLPGSHDFSMTIEGQAAKKLALQKQGHIEAEVPKQVEDHPVVIEQPVVVDHPVEDHPVEDLGALDEQQQQQKAIDDVAALKKKEARENFQRIGKKVINQQRAVKELRFQSAVNEMGRPATPLQKDVQALQSFLKTNKFDDFIVQPQPASNPAASETNLKAAKQQMIDNIIHIKLTKAVASTGPVDAIIKPTWDQVQDLKRSVVEFNAIQKGLNKPEIPFVFDSRKPLDAQMTEMWGTLGTHAKDSTAAFEAKGTRLTSKEAIAKLQLAKLGKANFFQKAWAVIKNKVDNWKMDRIQSKIQKTDTEHEKLLTKMGEGESFRHTTTDTNDLATLKQIREAQKEHFKNTKLDFQERQQQRQAEVNAAKISSTQALRNAMNARKEANQRAQALRDAPLVKKAGDAAPRDVIPV